MFFSSSVKSAQAQLNLINLWVVQVSDRFPSQIWTSPVTLQSIKPNYPHYKDCQIPLSNPFSFPRQAPPSTDANRPCGVSESDVILIGIPELSVCYPDVTLVLPSWSVYGFLLYFHLLSQLWHPSIHSYIHTVSSSVTVMPI